MASLSEIAKKHGVSTKALEKGKQNDFGRRRPWALGDEQPRSGVDPQQPSTTQAADQADAAEVILPSAPPPLPAKDHALDQGEAPATGDQLKNREQTGNKLRAETRTNRERTENEAGTSSTQTGNKSGTAAGTEKRNRERKREQTGNKTGNELGTKRERNREQTGNKKIDLADLCGLQERALFWLFDSCRFHGGRDTESIALTQICRPMKTTPGAAKETLKRLEKKGFIIRKRFKAGRGGWSVYELPEHVYQALSIRETVTKSGTNWEQNWERTGNKLGTEPGTEPGTTAPSSSSSVISNAETTTTAESRVGARAENEWAALDYSMLADIGFGKSQVAQLRALGIPFDVVQRSLVYFEFELRYTPSGKSMQAPLALLMKIMRQNGCWEPPEAYTRRHANCRERLAQRELQLDGNENTQEGSAEHQEEAPAFPDPETCETHEWR